MKVCLNCKKEFKSFYKDENGKRIDCRKRKYCLDCNPVGERLFWGGKPVQGGARHDKQSKECKSCGNHYKTVSRNLECNTCRNKKIRQERKAKAYQILGCKCKICGYSKCSEAMDIHHIKEGSKTFTLSQNWGLAWDQITKELGKCVLLCSRCHREVHAGFTNLNNFLGG